LRYPAIPKILGLMVLDSGAVTAAPPTRTVMIVDDDPLVLTLLQSWLETLAGHRVMSSISAAQAVDVCSRYPGPIDLLISDVHLAQEQGVTVSRQVSEMRPGLPVLFISGADGRDLAQRGLLDRRAAFLQKPFGAKSFLAVVEAMLA
jgi:two-component system cell cycle sensor histidine kinase/response regulator CckA